MEDDYLAWQLRAGLAARVWDEQRSKQKPAPEAAIADGRAKIARAGRELGLVG